MRQRTQTSPSQRSCLGLRDIHCPAWRTGTTILAFADELLDVASYPDYGPIGLQVVGADEVTTIACGVSSSRELFEHTAALGAQMVIVHHGLFWERDSACRRRGR